MFFIIKILMVIVPLLISVAYFTIAERKIMGSIQIRRGPNVIGYFGLLQPLADGAKLFIKEISLPNSSDNFVFLLAPLMALFLCFMGWLVIPFGAGLFLSDLNLGLIYVFTISALNIYSLLFAGWGSNSKYAHIGAVRSVAQMISYEISFSFVCLIIVLATSSYNLTQVIFNQKFKWFFITFLPVMVIFLIAILAETNRHPFDLPEAEAELVSGYNVEYSGMPFALFFLGEYANMLLMSVLLSILFLGGWFLKLLFWLPSFLILGLKIIIGVIFFIYNRAVLPRFRYDQLMELGWKCLIIFIIGYFYLFLSLLLISLNGFIS